MENTSARHAASQDARSSALSDDPVVNDSGDRLCLARAERKRARQPIGCETRECGHTRSPLTGNADGADVSESLQAGIVQGKDLASVTTAVLAAGGEVTHELGIINAVGARMSETPIERLEASDSTLRVQADRVATVRGVR